MKKSIFYSIYNYYKPYTIKYIFDLKTAKAKKISIQKSCFFGKKISNVIYIILFNCIIK